MLDIRSLNADFIGSLASNRAPGQVPFLPLETAEVERRFCQILDEEGYTPWAAEDGTPTGRWTALDSGENEIADGDWLSFLVRARKDCGFAYPLYLVPTAPEDRNA